MKRKAIVLFIALLLFAKGYSQNHIIVQNEQHIIYYKYDKEIIVFVIEDLKDNEDNFTCHPADTKTQFIGGPYLGIGKLCGQESTSSKLRDMAFIEFDSNHNGVVENCVDFGYTIPFYRPSSQLNWRLESPPFSTHYSYAMPYYIDLGRTTQRDFGFVERFARNGKSRVTGLAKWGVSDYKDSPHLIWIYSMPWDEIFSVDNTQVDIRFHVHRVSSYTGNEFYGSFFYPTENSCNGTTFYPFKLNMSDCPAFNEQKKVNDDKRTVRLKSSSESIKNAEIKVPEWDGVYVLLKNGKYIQLSSTPLNIAGYMKYQDKNLIYQTAYLTNNYEYEILKDRRFYYLRDQIELNSSILLLKKSDIKGIFVVASNSDPSSIAKASFSSYNLHQLDLDGYEILYPIKFSTSYGLSSYLNYRIQRETIYLQGEQMQIKRQSLPNNKYLFVPIELKKGVFSFWLEGTNSYIFEIVE